MTAIPDWIEARLDHNLNHTLTQAHVVEVMLEADRPFFSLRQVHARIKPDVSLATVRNRLNELQAVDVVATESYPDAITLYYIDHPESEWPLSPEGKQALQYGTPLDHLSVRQFLTMDNPAGIRTLVLAGFQWTLVLLALGAVFTIIGFEFDSHSDIYLWDSALELFIVSVLVLVSERTIRGLRDRYGPLDPFAD